MYGLGIIATFCLYFGFAIWVVKKNIAKYKKLKVKIIISIILLLIFITIPAGDEIAGHIYFNYLCEFKAGVTVYKTFEISSEYWNNDGSPKFYNGEINNDVPPNAFKRLGIEIYSKSEEKNINSSIEELKITSFDKGTGKIINEIVGFFYWGGWIKRYFFQPSAISCGGAKSYDDLVKKQFISTK